MEKGKLKPGHFWAEVWDNNSLTPERMKSIVIDICKNGCITVKRCEESNYFNDKKYVTNHFEYYNEIKPMITRYMTPEEMAIFCMENKLIVQYKLYGRYPFQWMTNLQVVSNTNPREYRYKRKFEDEWQEFIIEEVKQND